MANDIEIVIKGRNEAGKVFSELNRSIGQARRGAAAAWKELDVLAVAAEAEIRKLQDSLDGVNATSARQVTEAVGDLTRESITAATAVDVLADSGQQLAGAAPAAEEAAEAVDDIGDKARKAKDDVDGLGDKIGGLANTGGVSGLLGALGNIPNLFKGKSVGGIVSGMAGSVTSGIADGLAKAPGIVGKVFSATGPIGVVIAAGLAAGLGTALLTAVAGVGLSAAAGAGIAAGIAGAARDSRVTAAAESLKKVLGDQLSIIGTPFIKPVLDSIRMIGTGIQNLGLAEAFAPLASTIRPITAGLLSMAREAMPGIREMASAAVPFMRQLVADMPGLGKAVGDFASSLAQAGPGAAKLFHSILAYAEVTIRYFGTMIEWSSKFLDVLGTGLEKVGIFDFVNEKTQKFGEASAFAGSAVVSLLTGTNGAAEAARSLADELDAVKRAADDAWGSQMNLDEANLKLSDGLLSLTAAVRDNGLSLEEGTLKGNANREALLGLAKNAYDVYQAELAAGVGMTTASQHLYSNLQALADNADKAGYNRDMVNQLLSAYIALSQSPNINKTVNIYYRKIGHEGEAASGAYSDIPTGRIGGLERGGPVRAGEAYIVGEKRAELFVPTEDGMILPEVPSFPSRPSAAAGGGPGYAAVAPTIINIQVSALDPRGAADAVMGAIQQWERRNGSGWRS